MKLYKAELIDDLEIAVGKAIRLESLRQPVVPPYIMLIPFIETPAEIIIESQHSLDEDGVHGCIYQLKPERPCKGHIVIGFRDIQTGGVTRRKEIPVIVLSLPKDN